MGIRYQQVNVRIPNDMAEAIKRFCKLHGYQQSAFIRQAISDKLPLTTS
tara:strand:+ start:44 stop:190 length:147 start_codon:yes stop_codon:yes gene_type:complete